MNDDRRKTTKADFEKFKKTALKYQQKLGLIEYDIYFVHGSDHQGECDVNIMGKAATLYLGDEVNVVRPVESIAKHEVLHLLLARFESLARHRFVNEDDIAEENEALVRKLEKLIL
jgi:hypothetical protein